MMDPIMSKLAEIETAASRILQDADEQKKAMDKKQQERIAAYDKTDEEDTRARLEKYRTELTAARDRDLADIRQSSEKSLASLDEYYNAHHSQLVEQIFNNMIRK